MKTVRRSRPKRYTITPAGEEYLDTRRASPRASVSDALDAAVAAAVEATLPHLRAVLRRELAALLTDRNAATP